MSSNVLADSHVADGAFDGAFKSGWDRFVEDSSFDYRLRLSHFDLSPNRGTINKSLNDSQLANVTITLRNTDVSSLTEIFHGNGVTELPGGIPINDDVLKQMSDAELAGVLTCSSSWRTHPRSN